MKNVVKLPSKKVLKKIKDIIKIKGVTRIITTYNGGKIVKVEKMKTRS